MKETLVGEPVFSFSGNHGHPQEYALASMFILFHKSRDITYFHKVERFQGAAMVLGLVTGHVNSKSEAAIWGWLFEGSMY